MVFPNKYWVKNFSHWAKNLSCLEITFKLDVSKSFPPPTSRSHTRLHGAIFITCKFTWIFSRAFWNMADFWKKKHGWRCYVFLIFTDYFKRSTSRKYKLPIFVDWTLNGENDFLTFQIFYFPNPLLNLFFVEKGASIKSSIKMQSSQLDHFYILIKNSPFVSIISKASTMPMGLHFKWSKITIGRK